MRARLALALAVAAGLSVAGCGNRTPNVLVVLVDTLRVDRLGAYGSARGLTPFIDSLAGRGCVFRRAYAPSSWTNPSVASLFTSRYQSQHGVISFSSVLPEEELTLAELLKQHGFRTAAFVGNILVNQHTGFAQGFDTFENVPGPRATPNDPSAKGRAEDLNPRVLHWLDQAHAAEPSAPIFLYLHYMEPHAPYAPPADLLARSLDGQPTPDLARINSQMIYPLPPFDVEVTRAAERLYDAEIASLDARLRELFAALATRGFLDGAIVLFVADHGEEFLEHGLVGHHQTLYEEVIRVPLLLVAPGCAAHRDVTDVVSLVDMAPTLLELLGIPSPAGYEGRSVVPTIGRGWWWPGGRAGLPAGRPALSELIKAEGTLRLSPHEYAVVRDTAKLIVGVDGEREYYDLGRDPGERDRNLVAAGTRAGLDETLDRFRRPGGPARVVQPAIDPKTRERMRALGYVE
jgi:arylsulfatase A-like enzyme